MLDRHRLPAPMPFTVARLPRIRFGSASSRTCRMSWRTSVPGCSSSPASDRLRRTSSSASSVACRNGGSARRPRSVGGRARTGARRRPRHHGSRPCGGRGRGRGRRQRPGHGQGGRWTRADGRVGHGVRRRRGTRHPISRAIDSIRGRAHHRGYGERGDPQRGHHQARARRLQALLQGRPADRDRCAGRSGPPGGIATRSHRRQWSGCPDAAGGSVDIDCRKPHDRRACARRPGGGSGRPAVVARRPDRTGRRASLAATWRGRPCCSGICLSNAGLGAVHGLAAPIGALLSIAPARRAGRSLAATVRANIAAMERRDPDAVGLRRYATAGRLLAGLDDDTPDSTARVALVELLASWSATLDAPRLGALGLRRSDVPVVLAGVSANSMRTNPVTLTESELADILLG